MTTRSSVVLLAAATLSGIVVAGCSGGSGNEDTRCSPAVVRYAGDATDETCIAILDAEQRGTVVVGGANVSALVSPTSGGIVASTATALTITWSSPIDLDTATASARPRPPHEPPVTGAVHMVRLKGVAAPEGIATWVTTLESVTLAGATLQEFVGAPNGEVAIEITSVYLTENRILDPANDGPFRPATDAVVSVE